MRIILGYCSRTNFSRGIGIAHPRGVKISALASICALKTSMTPPNTGRDSKSPEKKKKKVDQEFECDVPKLKSLV